SPIKELIDWDQQRLDVQIKYTQVVEQFTVEDIAPATLQAPMAACKLPGVGELSQMLSRLIVPTSGSLEVGGIDVIKAPEAVTGRALAYVGPSAYLFPVSVRENLVYGLKHFPLRERTYEGDAAKAQDFQMREAKRTDSTLLDFNADWTDYQAAGAAGPEELDARIGEVLKTVELEESIFELGL